MTDVIISTSLGICNLRLVKSSAMLYQGVLGNKSYLSSRASVVDVLFVQSSFKDECGQVGSLTSFEVIEADVSVCMSIGQTADETAVPSN